MQLFQRSHLAPMAALLLALVGCTAATDEEAEADVSSGVTTSVLVQRSEYEQAGDVLFDLNDPREGSVVYSIVAGDPERHYSINPATGVLKIAKPIADAFGVVRTDRLTINASGTRHTVTVVDGYDWFLQRLPAGSVVLDGKNGNAFSNPRNEWSAFNNMHGKGRARPGIDFRMATIYNPALPDGTVFLWDVPSAAVNFGGSSVWSYMNVFWGNRTGMRDNLRGFPFRVGDNTPLKLDFNFEKLFGTDDYKISLNTFFTKESRLVPFDHNVGDFFMVFDQDGTFIPRNYADTGPDLTIGGKAFAMLHNTDDTGYETRRLIIRNNKQLLSGTIDVRNLFRQFSSRRWLDPNQYVYHLQVGVEVSDGFGAVRVNHLAVNGR